jgi:putative SOS response-associated peptidase YedK
MCKLYSITTNQAAIAGLFRVMNRYAGNLPPMPGVFPDYPAPVVRNAGDDRELVMMRWGMPPPPRTGGPPVTNIRNTSSPHCEANDSSVCWERIGRRATEWRAPWLPPKHEF